MGVLAYFSVPLYNKIIQKSDVSDALHNIEMLSGAQSKYYIENGRYTKNLGKLETPLRSEDADISTSNFTYFAGDPREDNYCIYSQSNIRNYTLARNYKTNSEVLCSGSDCDKISSFVQTGSLSDLCGAYNNECDKTCTEPKVLEGCRCVCPTGCSKKKLQNDDCSCYCAPAWREQCSGSNQVFDENDCSCSCKETLSCAEGQTFDVATCECVGGSSCELSDDSCKEEYGDNYIADLQNCNCIEQPNESCTLTNEQCQKENPNYIYNPEGDCECQCGISQSSCNSKQQFKDCACSCNEASIKECNGNPNKILTEDCACVCKNFETCDPGYVFNELPIFFLHLKSNN